tara:strand:- start:901 stop:1638 length:738 start_codon:yes stop_codon:yes gene_type:complete
MLYPVAMKDCRGNALFLILIAVALFAALSYAVTNSGKGGGSSDREQGAIMAAEILNYVATIQTEIQFLQTLYGVDDNQISFRNNNLHLTDGGEMGNVWGANPNCTAAIEPCSVFQESGGRVPSRNFYKASKMERFVTSGHPVPGEAHFFNQFIEGVGTTEPELLMYIIDLKDEVCREINRIFGLPDPFEVTGSMAHNSSGKRDYWNDATDYSLRLPSGVTEYIGEQAFCIPGYYRNTFVYTLIAR